MKIRFPIVLGCILLACQAHATNNNKKIDTLSYAMGYRLGVSFKQVDFPFHKDSFMSGVQSGYLGTKPALSIDEMKKAFNKFQDHIMKVRQEKLKKMSEANLAAGKAFLEKNKTAEGVKTLPNGLQYKVIEAGNGKSPTATDTVTVDYEGTLIDGTIFDSSYKRGQPAQFKVNQVITGWTQALQIMKEGATWMLYIPAELGYGARGAGPIIQPNSVLIFKVHLQKIN